MPTKPAKAAAPRTPAAPALAHRLHALLHTVRHIAHAEDELCTLLHAAEQMDAPLSPELTKELKSLLSRMPGSEYLDDLAAVRDALPMAVPQPRAAKKLSSKARKPIRAEVKPKVRKAKS